jgi:hypothetical protein
LFAQEQEVKAETVKQDITIKATENNKIAALFNRILKLTSQITTLIIEPDLTNNSFQARDVYKNIGFRIYYNIMRRLISFKTGKSKKLLPFLKSKSFSETSKNNGFYWF